MNDIACPSCEDSPPSAQRPRGWWFVPLPPERRAVARGASVFGLIVTMPAALAFGGFVLIFPLVKGPLDLGGLLCMGVTSGFVLAAVAHFLGCLRGSRLSLLGLLVIPAAFFGLACLVNGLAPDREWNALERRIAEGRDGEPEIAPDPELKAAFLALLGKPDINRPRKLYVRLVEKYETAPTPKSQAELARWKLDRDFATYANLNMPIPGSEPVFSDLHGGRVQIRLQKALEPIIPERRLGIEYLSSDDSPDGKPVLDIQATTRLEGRFSKFSSSLGRPSLLADIRIDWTVRLRDRDGSVRYSAEWTTRPSPGCSFSDVPLGADYAPYQMLQRSAHDNFARQLLGRLGLPPGPVKLDWSFSRD